MKNVEIERYRNCEECDGKGGQNVQKCAKCKGQGTVQKLVQLGPGMYTQSSQRCGDCKGEVKHLSSQRKRNQMRFP